MNTLYPELIEEDDEATFSNNLFKLYKLDERCGKFEAPSFRIIYLKDKDTIIRMRKEADEQRKRDVDEY